MHPLLTRKRHRLRFRHDAFKKHVAGDQPVADEALAMLLGMNTSQYTRVKNGRLPGNAFIAAVVAVLPDVPFTDLFDVFDEREM
jgi:hypothetical protein